MSATEELRRRQAEAGCRCNIHPEMGATQLLALEEGCTKGGQYRGGWVCPVLDWWRQGARRREGAVCRGRG